MLFNEFASSWTAKTREELHVAEINVSMRIEEAVKLHIGTLVAMGG